MRVTEILRELLDFIDEIESSPGPQNQDGYQERDTKRFRQIADLVHDKKNKYSTRPREQYADVNAVTNDAGADSWQGTKDIADIRVVNPSMYPYHQHKPKD
jgi:hypothetical protein